MSPSVGGAAFAASVGVTRIGPTGFEQASLAARGASTPRRGWPRLAATVAVASALTRLRAAGRLSGAR
ncbi:hypothetical protein ACFPN0_27045 [Kitasatospora cinereorecta]